MAKVVLMKKLRMGVIGLGSRGYGMMRGLSKHPEVEIVAVCDEYQDRVFTGVGVTVYAMQGNANLE